MPNSNHKSPLDLCRLFWREGDPRFWQTLSQKQSDWLRNVMQRDGVGDGWVGDSNEFLVRRFYQSNLLEIKIEPVFCEDKS